MSSLRGRRLWSLWEIMQSFERAKLANALVRFSTLSQAMREAQIDGRGYDLKLGDVIACIASLEALTAFSREHGLDAIAVGAARVMPLFEALNSSAQDQSDPAVMLKMDLSWVNQFVPNLGNLTFSVEAALTSRRLLSLNLKEQERYDADGLLFGPKVVGQFPSLTKEISEVGKCLALGRATAAAFHSIRCLEAAIRAMSRCLGIPDPTKGADRSWAKYLGKISGEMDRRWPAPYGTTRMSGDGKLFSELYGALMAMTDPYRNSTAHLDAFYDMDEAEHLVSLTTGLLQRVAARMEENGLPMA